MNSMRVRAAATAAVATILLALAVPASGVAQTFTGTLAAIPATTSQTTTLRLALDRPSRSRADRAVVRAVLPADRRVARGRAALTASRLRLGDRIRITGGAVRSGRVRVERARVTQRGTPVSFEALAKRLRVARERLAAAQAELGKVPASVTLNDRSEATAVRSQLRDLRAELNTIAQGLRSVGSVLGSSARSVEVVLHRLPRGASTSRERRLVQSLRSARGSALDAAAALSSASDRLDQVIVDLPGAVPQPTDIFGQINLPLDGVGTAGQLSNAALKLVSGVLDLLGVPKP